MREPLRQIVVCYRPELWIKPISGDDGAFYEVINKQASGGYVVYVRRQGADIKVQLDMNWSNNGLRNLGMTLPTLDRFVHVVCAFSPTTGRAR